MTATVKGSIVAAQATASGIQAGVVDPVSVLLSAVFRASGVAANQVDLIHAKRYTFAASTPQDLDMAALVDLRNNAQVWARARCVAIKVRWTADGAPLTVSAAAVAGWLGLVTGGGGLRVYPSSADCDGFALFNAPQTTGMAIGGAAGHVLTLDPGAQAGDVDVVVLGCSS